ncbi:MAG: hypothetical protein Q4G70_06220 [Pseudomonadota bacterium]|nr:hypothetical protein [Pseudomonadota bacterium]
MTRLAAHDLGCAIDDEMTHVMARSAVIDGAAEVIASSARKQKAAHRTAGGLGAEAREDQAVSPYTATVISASTSVCSDT